MPTLICAPTRRFVIGLGVMLGLLISGPVFAQAPATPSNGLAWDQAAPDLATAQGYVYRYYPDGAATGTILTAVCSGAASPFSCRANFPAFTPGSHTLQTTAANAAGESVKSSPFAFVFVVQPAAQTNLRIVP